MNFTVKRAELYDALKTALHAVTKSSLQAANGLLISADAHKGTVEITGTDIRTTVIKRIKEAAVTESGEVVAPQVTADIIRLAKAEEITLKTDENGVLTLLFGDSKYELPTIPAKEFPKAKITYPTNYVSVKGFGTLLRRCAFAAETRGEMQNIQCVRVKLDSGESRCEATDTKRIAMSVGLGAADGSMELLLHISAVNKIAPLADSGTVYVGISPPFAVFVGNNTVFATIMMKEGAPGMQALLERFNYDYCTETTVKALQSAVDTASGCLLAGDDSCVNITLTPAAVIIRGEAYRRRSEAALPALCSSPSPESGFNYDPRHITDFLRQSSGSLRIAVDRRGFMLLESAGNKYLVTPRREAEIREPKSPKSEKPKTEKKVTKAKKKKAA